MRYISLDIETTGLDPETCQVLELAMVLEDTENIQPVDDLPHFRILIEPPGPIRGEPYALWMNAELLQDIATGQGILESQAFRKARNWLITQGYDTHKDSRAFVAGKNVAGFDLKFLPKTLISCFHHRVIDPGSVFMNWEKGPQSLSALLGSQVTHNALQDAKDVITVLRREYAPNYVDPNNKQIELNI